MTGKPEKDKPAATRTADDTETIQAAVESGGVESGGADSGGAESGAKVVLPPIHVHGQHPEPEHIALAKIRCECLKLATEPTAYDQRPKLEKAQELYDWVIDPGRRFEAARPRVVETKPVDYSQANLPEEPGPATGRAGDAVDWSRANV